MDAHLNVCVFVYAYIMYVYVCVYRCDAFISHVYSYVCMCVYICIHVYIVIFPFFAGTW